MAIYFTNIGPEKGLYLYRDSRLAGVIGVLEAIDNHIPVGVALSVGWDHEGEAVRRLIVDGAEVSGRWIVVDREFRPADPGPTRLSRQMP